MEDSCIFGFGGFGESVDGSVFFVGSGVAVGCHDDAEGWGWVPLDGLLIKRSGGAGVQEVDKIGVQAHHQSLAFRVDEADIVFEEDGFAVYDHDAREEDSGEGVAVGFHAFDGGFDQGGYDFLFHRIGDEMGGGIGTHAAGVEAGIAVANAFVVLGGGEGEGSFAVGQGEIAEFFAVEEFFDDDLGACIAEGLAGQHFGGGCDGFICGLGDDDAFSGGEAIGFDDDGGAGFIDEFGGGGDVGEAAIGGGWDIIFGAKVFHEAFGAFELGGSFGTAEGRDVGCDELVGEAEDEWRFGADDDEVDLVFGGESGEGVCVFCADVDAFGYSCDACVTGGAV